LAQLEFRWSDSKFVAPGVAPTLTTSESDSPLLSRLMDVSLASLSADCSFDLLGDTTFLAVSASHVRGLRIRSDSVDGGLIRRLTERVGLRVCKMSENTLMKYGGEWRPKLSSRSD